jgi:hypothetical protein
MCVHVCIGIRMCLCIYIYIYIYMYMYMCLCMCKFICIYIYIHITKELRGTSLLWSNEYYNLANVAEHIPICTCLRSSCAMHTLTNAIYFTAICIYIQTYMYVQSMHDSHTCHEFYCSLSLCLSLSLSLSLSIYIYIYIQSMHLLHILSHMPMYMYICMYT